MPGQFQKLVVPSPLIDPERFRDEWVRRERSLCCIEIDAPAGATIGGTGMLVGPDMVLTNYHVIDALLGDAPSVRREHVHLRFDYKRSAHGPPPERTVDLAPDWYVAGSRPSRHDFRDDELPAEDELDYALIRLAERIGDDRGWIELPGDEHPVALDPDSFLLILQHPGLGPQMAAFLTNGVIDLNANQTRVRHRVGTRPGSSGAPCFDRAWNLVALHHGGDLRYPEYHHDAYNQAIPMWRIVRHLRGSERLPAAPAPRPDDGPRLDADKFRPTLIVLCTAADRPRADRLVEDAGLPPSYLARVGNQPPATVADNAVAVFLGGAAAMQDRTLLTAVDELCRLGLPVLPVVADPLRFNVDAPPALQAHARVAWPDAAPVPGPLRARVRQLLGLAIDPGLRTVRLCSVGDHPGAVQALAAALGARPGPYRVVPDAPGGESTQDPGAVLFIETTNAYASGEVRQVLKSAYTRGLPLVVWQCGPVSRRHPLIGALPVHQTADPARLADDHEAIAAALDQEIARAMTQRLQLGRMIQAVATLHARRDERIAVEPLDGAPHLMRMVLLGKVLGRETRSFILLATTHHRPSERLLQSLIQTYDDLVRRTQATHPRSAAVLLHDEAQPPLEAEETALFEALRGERLVYCIERQKLAAELPELMALLR